jgi:hypothetical protein
VVKEFFSLSEAAGWLSAQSGESLSLTDVLELAAAGRLPVCFAFRGILGRFPPLAPILDGTINTAALFPRPAARAYFDGWLKSQSTPDLSVVVNRHISVRNTTTGGYEFRRQPPRREHILRPRQVLIATVRRADPALADLVSGEVGYLARVNDTPESGMYGYLDDAPVPPADWRAHVEDLQRLLGGLPRPDDTSNPPTAGRKHPPYLKTGELAKAFNGLHGWDLTKWKKNLADPPKWMKTALVQTPGKGRNNPNLWDPIKLAMALAALEKNPVDLRELHRRFMSSDELKAWRGEWETGPGSHLE